MSAISPTNLDRTALSRRVHELGEWFHNLDLYGIPTAPNHFLGDFPTIKWKSICGHIPADLNGASVLDMEITAGRMPR
jgi:tRNA (mo5U34)-methyltransferase